mgnify:CR=1 FL=1|tara:strand:- start:35395 stop:35580 length:186 start_codon:yes stop_codon:yes gene_type:complete
METATIRNYFQEPYLKVVKEFKVKSKAKNTVHRIYINTLIPDFMFKNSRGAFVKPKNFVLL